MGFVIHLITMCCCSYSQASQAAPVAEEAPSPQIQSVQEIPGIGPLYSLHLKLSIVRLLLVLIFSLHVCVLSSVVYFSSNRIIYDMEGKGMPISQQFLQYRIN